MDDTTIIELFLCRNESAIQQTSKKYGNRLRLVSFGITQNYDAVEECENDTYLEAWNLIPPHEPKEYLYAFLAKIIRHISLNYCRNHNRLKRSAFICEISNEMEQCIPHPDDVECRVEEVILKEAINNFLGTLSEEKRNIFLRRYWYLDSITAISKRFAISEGKVKTILFRSRNQLRKYLQKEGYML